MQDVKASWSHKPLTGAVSHVNSLFNRPLQTTAVRANLECNLVHHLSSCLHNQYIRPHRSYITHFACSSTLSLSTYHLQPSKLRPGMHRTRETLTVGLLTLFIVVVFCYGVVDLWAAPWLMPGYLPSLLTESEVFAFSDFSESSHTLNGSR